MMARSKRVVTDEDAQRLRAQGHSYVEIARRLGISRGKAWIRCNREKHNKNTRESQARYRSRGNVPLWTENSDS